MVITKSKILWDINCLSNNYVQACFPVQRGLAIRPPIQESYVWQVSQLVAEHESQEGLPPIWVDIPSVSLEKEAKEENIRVAPL